MQTHKTLLAWQRAHAVVLQVLELCRKHWQPSASAVFNQLQRAALSVQLNIAEGYAVRSSRRFRNHLVIAYGSAVETSDLLELLEESQLVPGDVVAKAVATARESQALVMGLLKKVRRE
ncbi:MAG: four helix bundle protein [Gemmatimonadetes bacterium]|nr:four helix bundle protein [Gemmatimonadota bacterium]